MVPFESLATVSYSHSIETMESVTIWEIFSVRQWPDLDIWGIGHLKSLKMPPFDRSFTSCY